MITCNYNKIMADYKDIKLDERDIATIIMQPGFDEMVLKVSNLLEKLQP